MNKVQKKEFERLKAEQIAASKKALNRCCSVGFHNWKYDREAEFSDAQGKSFWVKYCIGCDKVKIEHHHYYSE